VILRDRMVVVGLADGRIQIHDLYNPPAFREVRVSQSHSRVTALASFANLVAAGTEDGNVKLIRLVKRS